MAKRQGQSSGAAVPSKSIKPSSPKGTGVTSSDDAERLQDLMQGYHEKLREIEKRVLDEGIESVDLYGFDQCRVLEGDELVEGLRRYDGVSLIQERVIELQDVKPAIDRVLAVDPMDADAKSLLEEQMWLKCILMLNGLSLLRCLRNTAFAMGLDPTPFTVVHENLTNETRASALGLAELMSLTMRRAHTNAEPDFVIESNRVDEPSLTKSQQTVLKTMTRFGGSNLLSTSEIRGEMDRSERLSEETIRLAIKVLVLADLVERPQGPRKGCRLTLSGRKLAGKIAD